MREKLLNNSLIIAHVPPQDQWVNTLTKPLSTFNFLPMCDKLRVLNKHSLISTPLTSMGGSDS